MKKKEFFFLEISEGIDYFCTHDLVIDAKKEKIDFFEE
jgi:hypothetical protein